MASQVNNQTAANKWPDKIPSKCRRCAYMWGASSPIAGLAGAYSFMTGCTISCPKCGATADMIEMMSGSDGVIYFSDFTDIFRRMDTPTLKGLKNKLEAANEDFGPEDLLNTLVTVEPHFAKFQQMIRGLSLSDILAILALIISLIDVLQDWGSEELDISKQQLQLTQQQLDLEREQWEYQKDRDDAEDAALAKQVEQNDEIAKKARDLENYLSEFFRMRELDARRQNSESSAEKNSNNPTSKPKKSTLKGCDRNKICKCGSGNKSKVCHPNGLPNTYRT